MSEFKQQYKTARPGFGHADQTRILRAHKHVESRREIRTRAFDSHRQLQDVSVPASPQSDQSTITDERLKKLIKWKEERKRKKQLENAVKKPAFKVGIVHHSLCSPVIRTNTSTTVTKASKKVTRPNEIQKKITRATEKRLLAKAAAAAAAATAAAETKQPTPMKNAASTSTKHLTDIKKPTSIKKKKQKSFAPANYEFRPPSGLHKVPFFGLVPIEQTPQEKGDFFIQGKSTDCKTIDINEQNDLSSQKSHAEIPDSDSTTKLKNSKLSLNKQKSSKKLTESNCDLNDITYELNESTKIKSSLKKEATQDSFEDKSLSDNNQMQTPLQKNTFNKENYNTEDLIVFSPYLTLSRGKKNARKEQQQRLGIGCSSSDEIPTKDTVMKNLNISVEEEERTAQYFKFLLNKETYRLQELCKKWVAIKSENDIPDDAMYEIHQAVGQTNLLINKKFERFRGLVQDCEIGKGEKLVTCRDLQGFWDMTYMEVRDCDSRFEKLEQRRNRGWQEEECTEIKPIVKKRVPIKKQTVSAKPSSLRSIILAARKKKLEVKTPNKKDSLLQDTSVNVKYISPTLQNSRRSLIFDNNTDTRVTRRSKSINVGHERKSRTTPVRHSRTSLTQKVQLSDSKKLKSPYVVMKISQMCKTPEVQLDDTISYINSDQTPGKSILKKSEELVDKESRVKSAHKVNFDDQVLNKGPLDEEMQIKLNLAAALNRIDNLDLDELSPQECINAERRLDFETEDSDFNLDANEFSIEIQKFKKKKSLKSSVQNNVASNMHSLNDTFSISDDSSSDDAKLVSPRKNLSSLNQHQNKETVSANNLSTTPVTNIETSISDTISNTTNMENESEIRVLRNRTIAANNTPKNDRTSKIMTPRRSIKKENKSPVKLTKKSSLKSSQKDGDKYATPNKNSIIDVGNMVLTENVDKRRKSSRKSVAFSAEACLVCTENKPVLPMTPHTKQNRSKTPSRRSQNKHAIDEDLVLWDTPKPLHRVTRSHSKN